MLTRIEKKFAGGASFGKLLSELLKANGLESVGLEKDWKNKKTVFVFPEGKFIIGDSSYVFNSEGVLDLEPFEGKTRKIKRGISSSFSSQWDRERFYIFED